MLNETVPDNDYWPFWRAFAGEILYAGVGNHWLAWKVATAAYENLETYVVPPKPIRLYQGWLLQFLNPKAWLMGLGAVVSFSLAGDRYSTSIVAISVGILVVNIIAGMI